LKPSATEYWPFRPPPNPDGTQSGDVIRVGGKISEHGIFMHPPAAPGAAAAISYQLDSSFSTFRTGVSINDGPRDTTSPSTFEVYADGRLVWRSKPVRSQADFDKCEVSVKGVQLLRIAVTCAGPPRGAHAVWLEPTLIR
jgi:hypothetical protein